jgi:phosphoglycolate phosphatase-like HAD superfamily hydrolase
MNTSFSDFRHSTIVRLAAERVGLALSDCLFVGDSRYDEAAALAAPVRFVGYRFGEGERVASLHEFVSRL